MKAIKIDVTNKRVEELDGEFDFKEIQKLLECDVITAVFLKDSHIIYVDDESLLKELSEVPGAFWTKLYPSQPLFGHGLVVKVDGETGEHVECTLTVEEVSDSLNFLNEKEIVHHHELLKNIPPQVITF